MNVDILGGGPGGLFLGILLKRDDPGHTVRVFERNRPDATFGWGVVFSEGSLDEIERADGPTHSAITRAWAHWNPLDVRIGGTVTRVAGNAFSGIGRKDLLAVLQARAAAVGVELAFEHEVDRLEPHLGADLVVAADGANSFVRRALADRFQPRVDHASSRYAWFGTDFAFPVFTYIFKSTEWGAFQAHCYPYSSDRSTMVVLAGEATWRRAGLDAMDEAASAKFCEAVFAAELSGHRILTNRSTWIQFPFISCRHWHHENVVGLGDAVHTAHWSIGSGTRLALEDAIALGRSIARQPSAGAAIAEYEAERQPLVERLQEASRVSCAYFENIQRYFHLPPLQFTYQLMTRTPRITHGGLTARDPAFTAAMESSLVTGGSPTDFAPAPALSPTRLASLRLANRLVLRPGDPRRGAGLRLTPFHAANGQGRHSSQTPVEPAHLAEAGDPSCLWLGHAGPRAGCVAAAVGVDIPAPGAEVRVAASAGAYGAWMPPAAAIDEAGMEIVVEAFAASATEAGKQGYHALFLDCARGGLVASFISPLTNRRTDAYGGDLQGRLRFPVEVVRAVRASFPPGRPMIVAFTADDSADGGITPADAVATAAALVAAGADALAPLQGQTIGEGRPDYSRGFGAALSDFIRNEARVPTMAAGRVSSLDEANTIIAAGRADLCLLDPDWRPQPQAMLPSTTTSA